MFSKHSGTTAGSRTASHPQSLAYTQKVRSAGGQRRKFGDTEISKYGTLSAVACGLLIADGYLLIYLEIISDTLAFFLSRYISMLITILLCTRVLS